MTGLEQLWKSETRSIVHITQFQWQWLIYKMEYLAGPTAQTKDYPLQKVNYDIGLHAYDTKMAV